MTDRDDQAVRSVADDLPVGVWVARAPGGEFLYANKMFAEIMGMPAREDVARGEYSEPYGIRTRDGAPYPEEKLPFVQALRQRGTVVTDDIVIHRTDGRKVNIRAQARPVWEDGEISHVVIAFIDITREAEAEAARSRSEQQLRQVQRMESVGTLAGGIAHDFNNLLAAVKILAGLLKAGEQDPVRVRYIDEIDQVTESAAQLTRALLGFARRGKHLVARLSVHEVIDGVSDMLRRTVDPRIKIEKRLHATGEIVGDYSQMEQVVLNLMVNARDAMSEGGRIVISTRDLTVGDSALVLIEVEDEGPGIDVSIRERVFEPYFTTKRGAESGGTGLGLATVWGIVSSHGGTVEIDDAQPRGTLMRVKLPRAPAAARTKAREVRLRTTRGRGTVLVVDDDGVVREATAAALRSLGYEVLCAASGREALELFQAQSHAIDAVLLDMVMPDMDGRATYLALREVRADVAVALTTGFARNEQAQRILDLGVREFLTKPYSIEALSQTMAKLHAESG